MKIPHTFISASLAMVALSACQPKEQEKPNILFLLVDDMRDAIAALGNTTVHTPHIDGLMSEGTTFTRCYTNGALCGALSMPSRAMLMTGRGIFGVQSDGLKIPPTLTTWPEHFRSHGYRTFATGKWHSDMASFNRSFAEGDNIFFGGMHTYESNGHCSPRLHHYDPTGEYRHTAFVGEEFSSKMFADAATGFLKTTVADEAPFLAFVSFTSPHDPRNQLPDYGMKYQIDRIKLPDNFLPQHPFDNGELAVRDELILPPPRERQDVQKELAFYYGMVSEVDYQIGRVLDALEQTGQRDNTIIVFASDNGLAMGQNGLLGKQSLYDHSVNVPMVIIDPRKERCGNRRSDALCYLYDIYPTLCDLAQIEKPGSVQGESLLGIVEGTETTHRDQLFLAYSNQQRALLKDGYKYIIYNVEGNVTEQLFNLSEDSGELVNLVQSHPEKAARYKAALSQEMEKAHDFCDLSTPLWWKDGHKLTWDELINLYLYE